MREYRLRNPPTRKSYNTRAGREIPHHTETIRAPDDAAAAREARGYSKFADEVTAQANPKIDDPRLERGELCI